MNTQIAYLEDLREDLLSAAWRETSSPARRSFRRPRRPSRGKLVAAMASVVIVLAGSIGWYTLYRGEATEHRLRANLRLIEAENEDLPYPIPSRAPAPNDLKEQLQDEDASANYAAGGASSAGAGADSARKDATNGAGGSGVDTSAPVADLTRIIKTAEMSVVVPETADFEATLEKARDIADSNGGFVSRSSMQPDKTGHLLIRVPARRFNATLNQLGSLGRLESQSIEGEDVTAEFVDLHARLTILQTRRTVLLKLQEKSRSIEQTIRIQDALDEVQLQIEQLQGQVRVIKNQTSKATIDLSLRKSGVPLPVAGDVDHPGLGSAWAHAIAGFFGVVFAVVVGLGYLVPVTIVALVAYLVARRLRRRDTGFVPD
jgi:hypothetical protein